MITAVKKLDQVNYAVSEKEDSATTTFFLRIWKGGPCGPCDLGGPRGPVGTGGPDGPGGPGDLYG